MVKEIGRMYMGEVIDIFFPSPRMWREGKREEGIYIWLITKFKKNKPQKRQKRQRQLGHESLCD